MTGLARACKPILWATLFVAPPTLSAQSVPALRDSLARLTQPSAVLALAPVVPGQASAATLLRAGWVRLRLYELGDQPDALSEATQAFRRANRLDPADPWATFGLGIALLRAADREDADPPAIVTGQAFARVLGIDTRSRAERLLEGLVEADPGFAPAAVALAHAAAAARDADRLERVRSVLSDLVEHADSADAETWLALATVHNALDHPDAAVAAARRALAAADGPDHEALHLLVQALLRSPGREAEATALWLRMVEDADEAVLQRMFDRLAMVATETEIVRWQAADVARRRAMLSAFWDVRAAFAGVTVPERFAAHERRIAHARMHFARRRQWGAPPADALLLQRPDLPYDDRGVIYVRHGPPARVIRTAPRGALPYNETWVYDRPDGSRRSLHFFNFGSRRDDTGEFGEWLLAYRVPCDSDWMSDRAVEDVRLGAYVHACDGTDRMALSAELRRDAYTALATDSDHPGFVRALPFRHGLWSFRGEASVPELVTVVEAEGDLDVRTIVIDAANANVRSADASGTHAVSMRLRAPAGATAVRVIVNDARDAARGGWWGDTLTIPDFGAPGLSMSDVVIATLDEGGPLRRGATGLRPLLGPIPASQPFRIYHEVYGLDADAIWQSEITIEPVRRGVGGFLARVFGGADRTRLRFTDGADTATGGATSRLRTVDANLEPGQWRLRLDVESAGRRVTRSVVFAVR